MTALEIFKFVDLSETQKSKYLEKETSFLQKKIHSVHIKIYITKNNFQERGNLQ